MGCITTECSASLSACCAETHLSRYLKPFHALVFLLGIFSRALCPRSDLFRRSSHRPSQTIARHRASPVRRFFLSWLISTCALPIRKRGASAFSASRIRACCSKRTTWVQRARGYCVLWTAIHRNRIALHSSRLSEFRRKRWSSPIFGLARTTAHFRSPRPTTARSFKLICSRASRIPRIMPYS